MGDWKCYSPLAKEDRAIRAFELVDSSRNMNIIPGVQSGSPDGWKRIGSLVLPNAQVGNSHP